MVRRKTQRNFQVPFQAMQSPSPANMLQSRERECIFTAPKILRHVMTAVIRRMAVPAGIQWLPSQTGKYRTLWVGQMMLTCLIGEEITSKVNNVLCDAPQLVQRKIGKVRTLVAVRAAALRRSQLSSLRWNAGWAAAGECWEQSVTAVTPLLLMCLSELDYDVM